MLLSVKPENKLEAEVFEIWKEMNPAGAYIDGVEECVGRVFEGGQPEITKLLQRIKRLRVKTKEKLVQKILDSFQIILEYEEPFAMPNQILGSIFGYMVKEGVNPKHMKLLLESSIRALKNSRERLSKEEWSVPLKILTQIACSGLSEVLGSVSSGTQSREVKEKVEEVLQEVKKYAETFRVEGFEEGRYEDVMKILSKADSTMGRAHIYEKWIRMAYDYTETAQELNNKGEKWIREELPKLRKVVKRLAKIHKCEPTVQAVSQALSKTDNIKGQALIAKANEARQVVLPYLDKFVVGINPDYKTVVMETPHYLAKLLPTAAAVAYNQLTDRPRQLYLVTTDEKLSPMSSLADSLNTLVHEEGGHTVNSSNVAKSYGAQPSLLERIITSHSGPITEGLSFQRELEFLEALKESARKRRKSPEERKLLEYLEQNGGVERRLLELEFVTRKWRLIRFLRVVGDARINSHNQNLPEFLEWAERNTGVDKKTVYYQLFPAHQTNGPGYATTYAVVGQEIAKIERKVKGNRKKLVQLTTYGCSIGYPPRTIYISRLRKFASKLATK